MTCAGLLGFLPSIPNLNMCDHNNCSDVQISCCSGSNPSNDYILKNHSLLQDQDNVFKERNIAQFEIDENGGIFFRSENPKAFSEQDFSWLCSFAEYAFSRKCKDKVNIQKLIIDDKYIIVEYRPRRRRLGRVTSSSGVLLKVHQNDWEMFSTRNAIRYSE